MPEPFKADRQFVDRLEWQLASEFRRAARLRSAGKIVVPRLAIVLAVVAGVLLTGVAASKAADLIKDSWRRKIELAKAESDVRLQRAWAQFKRDKAAEADKRFSVGLISQEDSQVMMLSADKSALELQRSEVNLEEVQRSGEAPRNDLYAPLVAGRDFVTERLEIDKKISEHQLELRGLRPDDRLRMLVKLGLAGRIQISEFLTAAEAEKAKVESLQRRIDLRKQFLSGDLSAEDVEIRDRIALAEMNQRQAQSRVDSLVESLEEKRQLFAIGEIPEAVVQALQLDLNTAEEELNLAKLEIETLKGVR